MATIYDNCSYFDAPWGLFGKYPTQEEAQELERFGVRLFVDLTTPEEGLPGYTVTSAQRIAYPITDIRVPTNIESFRELIHTLKTYLGTPDATETLNSPAGSVYIHCRGGHGRSGLVVACLIKTRYALDAESALRLTQEAHDLRREMAPKMRRLGAPQTHKQRQFVREFGL